MTEKAIRKSRDFGFTCWVLPYQNKDTSVGGTSAADTSADDTSVDGTSAVVNCYYFSSAKLEKGGPKGPEPTRFGDWERKGICVDF